LRGHLAGRELVGNGAARVLSNKPKLHGQVEVIDLQHDAVGLVGQLVAAASQEAA